MVQLCAPLQSALHEPPGQWNVQSAPFSHLYEQLPPEHVVSHVPPVQVQSFPLHVRFWFEELQAANRATRKIRVRIMSPYPVRSTMRFGYKDFRYSTRSLFSAAVSPRFMNES